MKTSASRKTHRKVPNATDAKRERRRVFLALGISALVGAPLAVFIKSKGQSPAGKFQLIDITGADYGRDFLLPDLNGVVRSLKDFKGEVVVVFFGFTQCPNVCPTTLTELSQARRLMGVEGVGLRGIFVTVDPERDTVEVLKAYLANFDPTFVALRPTPEQLKRLAADFRIHVRKTAGPTATSYSMDHTAASFVYDPEGRLRLYARYQAGAAALASDAKLLLKGV
jgi:protein SCO1